MLLVKCKETANSHLPGGIHPTNGLFELSQGDPHLDVVGFLQQTLVQIPRLFILFSIDLEIDVRLPEDLELHF